MMIHNSQIINKYFDEFLPLPQFSPESVDTFYNNVTNTELTPPP